MTKCPQFLEVVINLTTPCHTNELSVPGEEDLVQKGDSQSQHLGGNSLSSRENWTQDNCVYLFDPVKV